MTVLTSERVKVWKNEQVKVQKCERIKVWKIKSVKVLKCKRLKVWHVGIFTLGEEATFCRRLLHHVNKKSNFALFNDCKKKLKKLCMQTNHVWIKKLKWKWSARARWDIQLQNLNFKAGLFSSTFLFERSFCCPLALLVFCCVAGKTVRFVKIGSKPTQKW